ncbi:M23 family metallopeptidase [soil metagenome]
MTSHSSKCVKTWLYTLLVAISLSCIGIPSAMADWKNIPGQMTVDIIQAPTPLVALDKNYLVYELNLTNYHTAPAIIDTLEILTAVNQPALFKYNQQDLTALIHNTGIKGPVQDPFTIPAGMAKMVYLFLPFTSKADIPKQLIHQIRFKTQHKNEVVHLMIITNPLTINHNDPVIVSPPLRGDYWIAGNAPSNTSGHRTTNLIVNGHSYFAQRYAIDFVQIGKDGKTYHDDEHSNSNYYAYGQDILAVARGKVVALKDGIPENIPHTDAKAIPIELDTVGGNHLVIDIGQGHYAFYAHMLPGSMKVKLGDTVKRGQVLGKIGNTGNSTEPHLHFHIVDNPAFLGANGIPYAFDKFEVRASKLLSPEPTFQMQVLDAPLQPKTKQLVLEDTVVKFAP